VRDNFQLVHWWLVDLLDVVEGFGPPASVAR
jgi:hypothetical protein